MGGVAGVIVVFKLYWNKWKKLFIKIDGNPEKDDPSQWE